MTSGGSPQPPPSTIGEVAAAPPHAPRQPPASALDLRADTSEKVRKVPRIAISAEAAVRLPGGRFGPVRERARLGQEEETTMLVNPYLSFDGNCEEAFRFYEACLGGELFMLTYGQAPEGPYEPGAENRIMHASLRIGQTPLMGSDVPPQWAKPPAGFTVSLQVDTPEEADRVFGSLSDGGTVTMPLAETSWARSFGMFTDRFGIPWMVNCSKPMA